MKNKKLKHFLFESDEQGVSWFDVIIGGVLIIGTFVFLGVVIKLGLYK